MRENVLSNNKATNKYTIFLTIMPAFLFKLLIYANYWYFILLVICRKQNLTK